VIRRGCWSRSATTPRSSASARAATAVSPTCCWDRSACAWPRTAIARPCSFPRAPSARPRRAAALLGGYRFADWPGVGLIGLLVLIAGVGLAATGTYLRGIFEFVVGLDRWVLRVVAYVSLMTDQYPLFRLDQGAREPAPAALPGAADPESSIV